MGHIQNTGNINQAAFNLADPNSAVRPTFGKFCEIVFYSFFHIGLHILPTGDTDVEYLAQNGNDLVISTNAIEELVEMEYISEVVEFPIGYHFRLEGIGIEYMRSYPGFFAPSRLGIICKRKSTRLLPSAFLIASFFGQHHGQHERRAYKINCGGVRMTLVWQGQKDSNPRHAVLEWMWKRRGQTYTSQFSARLSRLCFQTVRIKRF